MTDSIPLFPPWCVVPPQPDTCTFLGIKVECFKGLDLDGPFGVNFQYGHTFTFIILCSIGIWNLSYARFPWGMRDSMKISTGLYAIITGFFALCRLGWGISRPLLIGAAIHNLFEWSFFLHVAGFVTTTKLLKKLISYAAVFITAVVVLVEILPSLRMDILVEQSTGIVADFLLCILFCAKYLVSRGWFGFKSDPAAQEVYYRPAMGTLVHLLFTILPLVFANFFVYENTKFTLMLEAAVYISSPITHTLYLHWSLLVDDIKEGIELLGMEKKTGSGNGNKDKAQSSAPAANAEPVITVLPQNLRIGPTGTIGVLFMIGVMLVSGGLAYTTLIYIPHRVMGHCEESPISCRSSPIVHSHLTAEVYPGFGAAFSDLIQPIIKGARQFPGNVDFHVTKSSSN